MHLIPELLLSTAYLPPIEYMALIAHSKNVIIEKEESYPKQTYRNRCRIMTANGILNLTIPVLKTNGNNTKTKDIIVLNNDRWFINHWRAMCSAYSGSPFFLYYKDDIEHFFTGEYDNLLIFNTTLLNKICEIIGLDFNVLYSDSFLVPDIENYDNMRLDYRYSISPKIESNPVIFEHYTLVFSNKFSFTPNLSILDLLFNLGPETKGYLDNVWNSMMK
ncbi:MAG: WbqC family protein [Bacteroidetes bacterium]|nr:WbqC family protein [Bacteroidota bacterium]